MVAGSAELRLYRDMVKKTGKRGSKGVAGPPGGGAGLSFRVLHDERLMGTGLGAVSACTSLLRGSYGMGGSGRGYQDVAAWAERSFLTTEGTGSTEVGR